MSNTHNIAKILVSTKNGGNILGRETATKLGILQIHNLHTLDMDTIPSVVKPLLNRYKDVVSGLGKLKGIQIEFDINDKVTPVAQHLRRVPFYIRKKIENKMLKD